MSSKGNVCSFWLSGRGCKFGDRCFQRHSLDDASVSNRSSIFGGRLQPQTSPKRHQATRDMASSEIVETIMLEMQIWEDSKMWPFSCYAFIRDGLCVPGFEDYSMEEMRVDAYQSQTDGTFETHKARIAAREADVRAKRAELRQPTPDFRLRLIATLDEEKRQLAARAPPPPSVFGASNPFGSTTSSAAAFGAPAAFGASTGRSVFGQSAQFGNTTASKPLFGGASPSVFGGSTPSAAPLFGSSTPAFGQPPLFGTANQQSSSMFASNQQSTSIFGAANQQTFGSQSAQPSIFGGAAAVSRPAFGAQPAFGNAPTTGSTSLFAAPVGAASTGTSAFGSGDSSAFAAAGSSTFGATTVFGAAASTAFGASGSTAFGSVGTSAFGAPAASSEQSKSNLGGASVFGSAAAAGQQLSSFGESVFGAAAASPVTSSTSIFGSAQPPTLDGAMRDSDQMGPNTVASTATPDGTSTAAGDLFGASGSEPTANTHPDYVYTPIGDLSEQELGAFKADTFEPGYIPLRPPPRELTSC